MICNISKVDRVVRILFSIVLIGAALYFVPSPVPKTLLLVVAVSLLASAWYGVCYFYKLIGINTARSKPVQPE